VALIENCRKLILAARIAIIGGSILLAAILFGAIRFDSEAMMVSIAALLGGIAVWGSNASTAKQAADALAAAEADRAALIGRMDLRVVPAQATRGVAV
jgi:hypothetical protein